MCVCVRVFERCLKYVWTDSRILVHVDDFHDKHCTIPLAILHHYVSPKKPIMELFGCMY